MYSRIEVNNGELYKEIGAELRNLYTSYIHGPWRYVTKPNKIYIERHHPEFQAALLGYDISILGYIVTVGVQNDGHREFYFDNPSQMHEIGDYYQLPLPFRDVPLPFKAYFVMSIRFDERKQPYLYKGYTTCEVLDLSPKGFVDIPEVGFRVYVYERLQENTLVLYAEEAKDIQIVGKDLLRIDGQLIDMSETQYIPYRGIADKTISGDPFELLQIPRM